jgi:hypothetical protein
MRRVVIAVDEDGKSYVATDEEIPGDGQRLWTHDPESTQPWIDAIDPDRALPAAQPPPRGVMAALASLPAGHGTSPDDYRLAGMDERGFHVTRTVDFIYVLDGGVVLDLDRESVELGGGDFVVLQAARHSWRNPTDHAVRFFDVLVSGVKD